MTAKLIVFEGPDKLGKTTQAELLNDKLNKIGKNCCYRKSPFDNQLKYLIYKFLQNGLAVREPYSFQELFVENRKLWMKQSDINKYDYVVLDRWTTSTLVYGKINGVDLEWLNDLTKDDLEPDLIFYFSGIPYSRTKFNTETGKIEEVKDVFEEKELQDKIAKEYEYVLLNSFNKLFAKYHNENSNDLNPNDPIQLGKFIGDFKSNIIPINVSGRSKIDVYEQVFEEFNKFFA